MVGGRDFSMSQFNRCTQAVRQPGSSFKPLIYAAALDKGYTQSSILIDTPLALPDRAHGLWKPENYDREFWGPIPLRRALVNSRNVVTVKLLNAIGVDYAIGYARHLGISSTDYFHVAGPPTAMTFLYTNLGRKRIFSLMMEDLSNNRWAQRLFPTNRYRVHRWVLLNDFEEIFASSGSIDKKNVAAAVEKSRDLKCAFLDGDGYWHIAEVHLPYVVRRNQKIYLQTVPFKIQPALLTEDFVRAMEENADAFAARLQGGQASIEGPVTHAQYVIDVDGFYTDLTSSMKRQWLRAECIKIFSRKDAADSKRMVF
jgi:hypothetical protein